jgi:HAMP domain-containing protein
VRIPLYLKLMASYLLVVGLVLLPAFFYVRTIQERELHSNLELELRGELASLANRLEAASPTEGVEIVRQLNWLLPHRVTLIDAEGNALADSLASGTLENHGDRPEVRAAKTSLDGFGSATRRSTTTGDEYLYTARRYPVDGPMRGVVRLAVSTSSIRSMESKALYFMNRAGAAALSLAAILSFAASLVLSRPLRRIADAARAFAEGDFGRTIDVRARDEIGDVGRALEELAAQLRNRLVSAGADRATLQGLLDELPVGVIVFGGTAEGLLVSGRARELCGFDASREEQQTRAMLEDRAQAAIVAEVLEEGVARDSSIVLPWQTDRRLRVRWFPVYDPDGARRPAVAISAGAGSGDQVAAMSRGAVALRTALATETDAGRAKSLLAAAQGLECEVPLPAPDPARLGSVALSTLVERAEASLGTLPRLAGVRFVLHGTTEVSVADVDGRCERAMAVLLASALVPSSSDPTLTLRCEEYRGKVKVSVDRRVDESSFVRGASVLRDIGGDLGFAGDGAVAEAWISFPRGS